VSGLGLPLRSIYWSSAALTLGIVVLLVFGSREVRPERVPTGSVLRLAFGAVRGVFTDRATLRIFALFGVALLANQMIRPYVPLLVVALEGSGAGAAGAIALVTGAAALVGAAISPIAGGLGDRVGFRAVLGGALAVAAVVVALMPLAGSVPGLAVGYAAIAGCSAATSAMIFGLLAIEVPAERRSATLNLVYLPLYVAGIVGPAVGSVVAGVGVNAVFFLGAVELAIGAIAVAFGIRRRSVARPAAADVAVVDATIRELEAETSAELR
jgi:MFS family permease